MSLHCTTMVVSRCKVYALFSLFFLGGLSSVGAGPLEEKIKKLEIAVETLTEELRAAKNISATRQPTEISHLRLPKTATLCGDAVPLSQPDVYRRVEFEFLLMLQDRAQVAIWMKRAQSVFPRMDKIFAEKGACDDLKYLALIESGLRSWALSSAKAKGYWQFIPSTAKIYNLSVTNDWDQRSDFRRSTEAGIDFLNELRDRFGTWPLAMAGYNTGPTRLQNEIEAQKVSSYWRLKLFREAERYVPRVIAAKLIMQSLEQYGFDVGATPGWSRPPVDYVRVRLARHQSLNLKGVADGGGLDYRMLVRLNPELMNGRLTGPTNVVMEVPKGKATVFRAWTKRHTAKHVPRKRKNSKRKRKSKKKRKPKKSYYTVRGGDTLWDISQKFGISVAELRKLNRLQKRSVIKVGDELRVKRR